MHSLTGPWPEYLSCFWCSSGANLDDVPVLNHCSKQLFVFRVILFLLQVGGMLGSKW